MKLSSFILSFVVLFQSFNFDLGDLQKLPNFINDVSCHINDGESFSDFIGHHYLNSDSHEHNNEDSHEHEKHGELPFKHQHSDSHFQLMYVFLTNEIKINGENLIVSNNNFFYNEPSTNLGLNSIFQPPKV